MAQIPATKISICWAVQLCAKKVRSCYSTSPKMFFESPNPRYQSKNQMTAQYGCFLSFEIIFSPSFPNKPSAFSPIKTLGLMLAKIITLDPEICGYFFLSTLVLSSGSERKKNMTYDLRPVFIPYLVSQNS